MISFRAAAPGIEEHCFFPDALEDWANTLASSSENLHLDVELDETDPEVCGTCHNDDGGGIWLWLDVAGCGDKGGSSFFTDGVVQCCKRVVGETGFVDG